MSIHVDPNRDKPHPPVLKYPCSSSTDPKAVTQPDDTCPAVRQMHTAKTLKKN